LLTGFSPLIGNEEIEQSIRTRLTFVQAEQRLAASDDLGADGNFTVEQVKQISYSARNHAAELVLDDLVTLCSGVSDWSSYATGAASVLEIAEACTLLGEWDGRHTLDSVGGHIFTEFWRIARQRDDLWQVPFSSADPVNTPNTLNVSNSIAAEALRQALADGVSVLLAAGIALDQPWGDVSFDEKNGERIPIHGGSSGMLFSVITSDLIPNKGYADIEHGNSYMQAVTWDETDCPDVSAMLTYSQSTDPASAHYADATKLYSESGWIDMAYCQTDIEAAELRRQSISQ
jgi:acyl-homoserine-lactone acylase